MIPTNSVTDVNQHGLMLLPSPGLLRLHPLSRTTEKLVFSAKEAETLTGVGPIQQQNYRRQGYLPPKYDAKWTRYDLHEVALLLLIGQLSAIGVRPSTGGDIAKLAAPYVCKFAKLERIESHIAFRPSRGMTRSAPSGARLIVFIGKAGALRHQFLLNVGSECSGRRPTSAVTVSLDLKFLGKQLAAGVRHLQAFA